MLSLAFHAPGASLRRFMMFINAIEINLDEGTVGRSGHFCALRLGTDGTALFMALVPIPFKSK